MTYYIKLLMKSYYIDPMGTCRQPRRPSPDRKSEVGSLIDQGFCIFALPFERISALSKQHKSLGRMHAIAMPHGVQSPSFEEFVRRAGLREILFCGFWKSTSLSSVGLE